MSSKSKKESLVPVEHSALLNRTRKCEVYCVACRCKEDNAKKMLRCSRCQFARYCSPECQKHHWPSHKHDCLMIDKYQQNALSEDTMLALGAMKHQLASDYARTFEEAKEMFEDALDCFLQVYEKIRNDPSRSANENTELRSRIPFYLAALGHDDLAVAESRVCMVQREQEVPRALLPRQRRQPRLHWQDSFRFLCCM